MRHLSRPFLIIYPSAIINARGHFKWLRPPPTGIASFKRLVGETCGTCLSSFFIISTHGAPNRPIRWAVFPAAGRGGWLMWAVKTVKRNRSQPISRITVSSFSLNWRTFTKFGVVWKFGHIKHLRKFYFFWKSCTITANYCRPFDIECLFLMTLQLKMYQGRSNTACAIWFPLNHSLSAYV